MGAMIRITTCACETAAILFSMSLSGSTRPPVSRGRSGFGLRYCGRAGLKERAHFSHPLDAVGQHHIERPFSA